MRKDAAAGGPSASFTLDIPVEVVKFVIGKQGATIKALEAESGASLRIIGRRGGDKPQQLLIKGATDCVAFARGRVEAILDRHSEPDDGYEPADDSSTAGAAAASSSAAKR
jgi:hypothetical protein